MHHTLSASEAGSKIRTGTLTSVDLVEACLARIDETDGQLKAWAHLDADQARAQAAEMDAIRQHGRPMGPLHGLPVGLKDIIDSRGLPAERGSAIFAGREPESDAALVERLREAGAVILGKTVTTELAFLHPAETRNPHDADYSPGGSSAGSAAAVGAFQVPLAVGSQTNGSVIRPASFCGVYGFKPTTGVISRRGLLQTSMSLDQVGVFARTLEDTALLTDAIGYYDPADPLCYGRPRPNMFEGCHADPPVEPSLVWFDLPFNDRLSADAREGLDEILEALGTRVEKMPAPGSFADLIDVQGIIHHYEFCHHLEEELTSHIDKLSPTLGPIVERGRAISDAQYQDALEVKASATKFFGSFFKDFDAIIAPSAAGEPPAFEAGSTGDPIFCTIWTLCGLPALTIPLLVGGRELPIGVQLIGALEQDDRLLRTASWLLRELQPDAA